MRCPACDTGNQERNPERMATKKPTPISSKAKGAAKAAPKPKADKIIAAAKRGQSTMFDREVNDSALEDMIRTKIRTADPRSSDDRREHRKAKEAIDTAIHTMKAKPGDVIKCGAFLIPVVARGGGGYNLPHWDRTIAGKIQVG